MFIKFRKANTSFWQHATINYGTNGNAGPAGHTQPAGSNIRTPQDGKGIWIYRAGNGAGNVNFNGASLRWNYGADGVLDNDSVEVRVYALEMVYCTSGQFYLGSNGTETGAFRVGNSTNTAYLVGSESAITVGGGASDLGYGITGWTGDGSGPIPAAYPKGYNAFWSMKYECSQQQYADFMNAIDAAKAAARNPGNGTVSGTPGNYIATNPERAINGLGHLDNLAFLDWAGLRPMTELEYEKACRGYNILPIANERAWGNTTTTYTISVYNSGTATETNVEGNATYYPFTSYLARPIRCGAYANDTTDTRTETGGTYYGAMEMSGNLWESVVTAGNPTGRSFTGVHGDGNLNASGDADAADWNYLGMGFRGGAFDTYEQYLAVSNRENASYNPAARQGNAGVRGVRTAE